MSKRGKSYTAEFKAKVVLEFLSGDQTLNQVCSKHGVTPKSLKDWKAKFINNASLAFNIESAVSGYKEDLKSKAKEVDELHRQLGKRTAELEWATKKLNSLDFEHKKRLIKSELNGISLAKQCELFGFHRSSYYYQSQIDQDKEMSLLKSIDNIYTEIPFYGYRKVHQELSVLGFKVGVNQVRLGMRKLGLKTIYPTKRIKTTLANPEHKKHPYLLRDLEICRANQVWSTDITYLKVKGGFMYLAAVIDWHTKAILSHKISNSMDNSLVLDVLQDALAQHGKPEIFNTDQGSQYTSNAHTQLLIDHDIKISMDGKGRATDNIAIERFWRSAKYENIYINEYKTVKELKAGVTDYIKFYNHRRFHQTLDYRRPMEAYNQSMSEQFEQAA
jgi:putative transposase